MHERSTADLDRDSIRRAMVALLAERGYGELTVDLLLATAGVGRDVFVRHFRSLDECFNEVWEECKDSLVEVTSSAFASQSSWRDGMRAAAWAFCRWIREDHARARVLLVDLNDASERVSASRDFVMESYIGMIDKGNIERRRGEPVPRAQAEGIMGGIWDGAALATKSGAFDDLPAAIPQAMYVTVYPYLGIEAAEEELDRGPADIARYERDDP
jgi:AcrR family transcriptional regulator